MKKYLKITLLVVVAAIFIGTFIFLYQKSKPKTTVYETVTPEIADLEKTTVAEIGVNSGKDHYSHFQVSFGMAIGTCLLLVTLGLLAGLAPAYRAMAIRPIEAIRDE